MSVPQLSAGEADARRVAALLRDANRRRARSLRPRRAGLRRRDDGRPPAGLRRVLDWVRQARRFDVGDVLRVRRRPRGPRAREGGRQGARGAGAVAPSEAHRASAERDRSREAGAGAAVPAGVPRPRGPRGAACRGAMPPWRRARALRPARHLLRQRSSLPGCARRTLLRHGFLSIRGPARSQPRHAIDARGPQARGRRAPCLARGARRQRRGARSRDRELPEERRSHDDGSRGRGRAGRSRSVEHARNADRSHRDRARRARALRRRGELAIHSRLVGAPCGARASGPSR